MRSKKYEDRQFKVRLFLNSECSLFARFLPCLESVDREIDLEDIQDYATSDDFPGLPADVTWMNQQLFKEARAKVHSRTED